MLVYKLSIVAVVATANHHILTTPLNYKAQLIPVLTVPSVLAVACAQMVLACICILLFYLLESSRVFKGWCIHTSWTRPLDASARVNLPFSH